MSTIGGRTIAEKSFDDFMETYTADPKPIMFWDTCGMLEYIRFVYRENKGLATLNAMMDLARRINNHEIYSVTSALAAIEWDDNVAKVMNDMANSLERTEAYHALAVETINILYGLTLTSVDITAYRLADMLRDVALDIAEQTHYLLFKDITEATLERIALKSPPAHKKGGEIKDCAMWESMLHLCEKINKAMPGGSPCKVFYTVNIADFADRSRGRVYFNELQEEARQKGFYCMFDIDEAVRRL